MTDPSGPDWQGEIDAKSRAEARAILRRQGHLPNDEPRYVVPSIDELRARVPGLSFGEALVIQKAFRPSDSPAEDSTESSAGDGVPSVAELHARQPGMSVREAREVHRLITEYIPRTKSE